jgi:protein XagA
MGRGLGIALVLAGVVPVALPAEAGPWTRDKATAQFILKYEVMRAEQGFDPDGNSVPLLVDRRDTSLSLLAEYGLTDRLTLVFKSDWQTGSDAFVDYEGRGPLEIGLAWQVYRDPSNAVALQVSYVDGGEGRNAGYAAPGVGTADWEVRVSAGRSLTPSQPLFGLKSVFVDVQGARRFRRGLEDETRVDVTLGGRWRQDWLVLGQLYGGQVDNGGPRWLSAETSVVRDLGDWSLQVGWRTALAGRETPQSEGWIVGVWRRF